MKRDDKTESPPGDGASVHWVLLPAELLSLLEVGDTRKLHLRETSGSMLELLLVRDARGLTAIDTLCPHAGGRLEESLTADGTARCPLHDLHFDPRTGESVGQTCRPATVYPLRFSRAGLEVGLQSEAILTSSSALCAGSN